MVYSVPDMIAKHLEQYCMEFCSKWIWESPHAQKYRNAYGVCYNEADFIEYLNRWIFPDEHSIFVENLGAIGADELPIPEQYSDCPTFNF